ncbi:MAG: LamG domain-containing protein [Bacteroidetes bacterium]|nr:LamG domain-containing protein [Bacteroidota bacterium]
MNLTKRPPMAENILNRNQFGEHLLKTPRSSISLLVLIFTFHFSLFTFHSFSQGIAINTSGAAPNNSAMLDVSGTSQGVLINRMTTTQRNSISSPAAGLFIYNTDCKTFEYYDGSFWIPLYSSNNLLSTPGGITGISSACSGQTGVTYSIPPVPGATTYNWTLPSGSSITSGQNTSGITVTFGSTSGNICVTGNSDCGTSSPACLQITITPNVGDPVFSLGASSSRCQGAGNVTYGATASNSTGITYTLDAASITGGNSIVAGTGDVTYAAGWSGTTVITASAAGCNGPTTATHTVTINQIEAPTATAATEVASLQFKANWNTVTNAASYALDVSTNNTFASGLIINNQNVGNVLTYNVTGLTAGITYYYRVRAVNTCTSGNSNTITATTLNIAGGLIAYWKFDESNGNATSSVGSNTLTNNNSVTYVSGKIGNASSFDKTIGPNTQYLSIADKPELSFSTAFTVSSWINLKSNALNVRTVFAHKYSPWITFQTSQIIIETSNNGTTELVSSWNGNWTLNTWYHMVVTYDGSLSAGARMKVYINNVLLTSASENSPSSLNDPSSAITIGHFTDLGERAWDGLIDEMGVWSRALTSTEVTTLYNSGAGLQYPF